MLFAMVREENYWRLLKKMTESFHETDFLFFFKYMASLFCRLKFKQRYYRIMFSNLVKVRLSSLSGFQHTICKTFGIFSDYSLVIRAKGPARVKKCKRIRQGSRTQTGLPMVKRAKGLGENQAIKKGQKDNRVHRESKGQKGPPRVPFGSLL